MELQIIYHVIRIRYSKLCIELGCKQHDATWNCKSISMWHWIIYCDLCIDLHGRIIMSFVMRKPNYRIRDTLYYPSCLYMAHFIILPCAMEIRIIFSFTYKNQIYLFTNINMFLKLKDIRAQTFFTLLIMLFVTLHKLR